MTVFSSIGAWSDRPADDVLKARLKTVGVSEYRFQMESGTESGTEWRIIDVGGSRSQVRLHLLPFRNSASSLDYRGRSLCLSPPVPISSCSVVVLLLWFLDADAVCFIFLAS